MAMMSCSSLVALQDPLHAAGGLVVLARRRPRIEDAADVEASGSTAG